MGKQRRILLLAAVLFVIGSALLYQALPHDSAERQFDVPDTSIMPSRYDTGEISIDASGQNVYLSNKYGFRFIYPQGWRIGDNNLGYGVLQFFNYPASDPEASSRGFARGENKIEILVGDNSPESTELSPENSEYPDRMAKTVRLTIGGMSAIRVDNESIDMTKSRTYILPLQTIPGKSLIFVVYGDSSNFHVLDEMVRGMVWKLR